MTEVNRWDLFYEHDTDQWRDINPRSMWACCQGCGALVRSDRMDSHVEFHESLAQLWLAPEDRDG